MTDADQAEMAVACNKILRARIARLEHALCAATDHDPSCPIKPTTGYDPLLAVEGCTCAAHLAMARVQRALAEYDDETPVPA